MPQAVPTSEDLYIAYAPGLLAFLYARLRSHAAAEDVLHDIFLAYLRQKPSAIRSAKAYLYRCAHHASLTALRNRAVASAATEQMAASTWRHKLGADPVEAEALRQALDGLPDDDRETLVLRVHGGMTFQEVADTLGAPLTTTFERYHRALDGMRRAMDPSAARPPEGRS